MKYLGVSFAFTWITLSFIAVSLGAIGWILNIVKVFDMWGVAANGELILRVIGIPVAFLGAVLGWF